MSNSNLFENLDISNINFDISGQNEDLIEVDNTESDVQETQDLEIVDKTQVDDKSTEPLKEDKKPIEGSSEEDDLIEIEDIVNIDEEKQVTEESQDDAPNESYTDLLNPLAVFLKDRGIIPDLNIADLEDKSHEEILETIRISTENRIESQSEAKAEGIINQYVNSLPKDAQFLLENLKEGVSFKDLLKHNSIDSELKNIKEEDFADNEELSKKVIKMDFLDKGFSPEDVDDMIDNMLDTEVVAKKSFKNIQNSNVKRIEEGKLQAENQEKQRIQQVEQSQKEIKNYIDNSDAIMPGFNLVDKEKDQIYNYLTKPVGKDKEGNPISYADSIRRKDPLKFEAAMINFLIMTNGLENYDKFTAKAKSNATKDFEKALQNTKGGSKGSPIKVKKGKTSSDWDSFAKNFNK